MDCRYPSTSAYQVLCLQFNKALQDDSDDLQKQIYIVSGALGGVILILIIAIIILAVQLNRLWKGGPSSSTGFNAGNLSKLGTTALGAAANNAGNLQDIGNTTMPTMPTPSQVGGVANGFQRFQPPSSLYSQPNQPKHITSEEELAHMGFSSYTGHPVEASRALSVSPSVVGSAAGGVRVLPRNPPTGFRHNAAGYNEGYM